nr:MAG TPA: hypothetical protein [Caudoviricetes sp.]
MSQFQQLDVCLSKSICYNHSPLQVPQLQVYIQSYFQSD